MEVYDDNVMSHMQVFEWHKWFMEGRQEVKGDERLGPPSTSKTEENVEKISEIVQKDRRLSIQMIAEMVNMDKETVRQVLHDRLNMRKVCAKMVLKTSLRKKRQLEKHLL
jgi:hypothetical protein